MFRGRSFSATGDSTGTGVGGRDEWEVRDSLSAPMSKFEIFSVKLLFKLLLRSDGTGGCSTLYGIIGVIFSSGFGCTGKYLDVVFWNLEKGGKVKLTYYTNR